MRSRDEWNDPPSDSSTPRVAVPAEVEHRRLRSEQVERELQPGSRGARVDDEVEVAARAATSSGRAKPTPSRVGHVGSGGVHVDERHPAPGDPGEQPGDAAAHHPRPDDGDPVTDPRRRVPERVDGRLDRAREHGPSRRHVVGDDDHRLDGDDVCRLVRVQAEDRPSDELRRPLLDDADAEVAVLHRRREVTLLVRGAHDGVLVLGHGAAEDDRLGAAAHARVQGAHEHLARAGRGHGSRPDLAPAGLDHPERPCIGGHATRLDRP